MYHPWREGRHVRAAPAARTPGPPDLGQYEGQPRAGNLHADGLSQTAPQVWTVGTQRGPAGGTKHPRPRAPTGSAAGRAVRGARAERHRRVTQPRPAPDALPPAEGHLSWHSTAQDMLAHTPATTHFVTSEHHLSRNKSRTGNQERGAERVLEPNLPQEK